MNPATIHELKAMRRKLLDAAAVARRQHRGTAAADRRARAATLGLLRAEVRARHLAEKQRALGPDLFERMAS